MPINSGDDRRRLVPQVLVRVLTHLIDEEGDMPSATRVELRSMRSRLARLYALPDPQALANTVAVMQQVEEDDGVPTDGY